MNQSVVEWIKSKYGLEIEEIRTRARDDTILKLPGVGKTKLKKLKHELGIKPPPAGGISSLVVVCPHCSKNIPYYWEHWHQWKTIYGEKFRA